MKHKILQYLKNQTWAKPSIILGGHFSLVLSKTHNTLIPCIPEDMEDDPVLQEYYLQHPYVSYFPKETFDAATDLVKDTTMKSSVVLLTNDWQFVPKAESSKPNLLREDFYKTRTTLPASFDTILKEKKLPLEKILKPNTSNTMSENKFYFSETKFRNLFSGSAFAHCELGTQCAQEFLPFLIAMNKLTKMFVAFIPPTCLEPTTAAVIEAQEKYGVTMDIVCVYPFKTTNKELFWSEVQVYKNGNYIVF